MFNAEIKRFDIWNTEFEGMMRPCIVIGQANQSENFYVLPITAAKIKKESKDYYKISSSDSGFYVDCCVLLKEKKLLNKNSLHAKITTLHNKIQTDLMLKLSYN
jgi:hypothetical protein